jgi:hypothetical protein
VGMNARWAARLAVPRAEVGRELLRNAATANANVRSLIERR